MMTLSHATQDHKWRAGRAPARQGRCASANRSRYDGLALLDGSRAHTAARATQVSRAAGELFARHGRGGRAGELCERFALCCRLLWVPTDRPRLATATGTLIKVLSQYIREAQENDKLEAAEAGAEVAPVPLDLRLVSDDLEYVDVGSADEPHLRCAFCQLVSVEPLVAECGHLFCMACLELHANQKTCPLVGSLSCPLRIARPLMPQSAGWLCIPRNAAAATGRPDCVVR